MAIYFIANSAQTPFLLYRVFVAILPSLARFLSLTPLSDILYLQLMPSLYNVNFLCPPACGGLETSELFFLVSLFDEPCALVGAPVADLMHDKDQRVSGPRLA